MRFAVNTRLLLAGRLEGIGRFSHELLRRLVKNHPEVEWIFLFDRHPDPQFIYGPNVTAIVLPPPTRHPLLWWFWMEFRIPRALKKAGADLFFSPDGFASLHTSVPQAVVIHDLNFEHYPHFLPFSVRRYYRRFFPRFAHKARRVITVSHFSAGDISGRYGVDPGKIDVVPNAISEEFRPLGEEEKRLAANEYAGGAPYFVFVGAFNPRKNLVTLLRAFGQFSLNDPDRHKLVLVGAPMFRLAELEAARAALPFPERLVFAGRLDNRRLNHCLGGARGLAFPSVFEGFGIPVVEAFACGVPVLTSSVSSLPEVAGGAALLVDPMDADAIAEGLSRLATDSSLREDLIGKGFERARDFSWDRSAELLWESLLKTLPRA